MYHLRRIVVLALAITITSSIAQAASSPVSRILFGSCAREQNPIPIFHTIAGEKADVFLFIGDNVYGDTTDMDVLRSKYSKLRSYPGFANILATSRVYATWDDHDYGQNDAGAEYPQREASEQIFLDFWNVSSDAPSRQRPGIYDAHMFGSPEQRVQLIILDTRYFRGPLEKGERRTGGPYVPSSRKSSTMLGADQWKWLEEQLRQPAKLRIIASSIQCIPEASGQETWSNLPHERDRFFSLIKKTKANGVVIISGDRHWAELSALSENVPYTIYDLTSSSFNQLHKRGTPTANRFRAHSTTYHQENFGAILVDWKQDDPTVTLQIKDMAAQPVLTKSFPLSELSPGN